MAEQIVVDIEFKTNVKQISKDLNSVKDSLKETNDEMKDIKKSSKGSETALGKLTKGFKGFGLALKTTGVMLIVEAFKLLKDVVMKNQTIVDGLSVATETLSVLFNQVTSVITDIVSAVSKSTEGFDGLAKVMSGLLTLAITPLKTAFFGITLAIQEGQLAWEQSWLGGKDTDKIEELTAKINNTRDSLADTKKDAIDAGKDIVTNFAEAVTEVATGVTIATQTAVEGVKDISVQSAITTGQALADAKKNQELLEIQRQQQQLQSQLDAEIQRQIRDDVSKTFEERIQANEELAKILDKQLKEEKSIADERVRIAKLELDTNKDNIQLQEQYQRALLEQVDIEERIAGQRSEQLTNTNSLIKEQEDAVRELSLAGMTAREQELEAMRQDYETKVDLARKTGSDITEITRQYNQDISDLNDTHRQEDLDSDKALKDAKDKLDEEEFNKQRNMLTMVGELFSEHTAIAKASAFAVATMDTYRAVNLALASSPPPFSFIQAGITLAAGLKNVKEILGVKTKKPVSASVPSGSIASGGGERGTANEEQLVDLSNTPSMVEQFNTAFTQDRPVRAYVLEQDVTNAQQVNTMIEQNSTL